MNKMQKSAMFRKFSRTLRERQDFSSGTLRRAIQDTTHEERAKAWDEKRSYGYPSRAILLAYGYAKGMPYRAIEPKTGQQNPVFGSDIIAQGLEIGGVKFNETSVYEWREGAVIPFESRFEDAEFMKEEESFDSQPPPTKQETPRAKIGFVDRVLSWVGL